MVFVLPHTNSTNINVQNRNWREVVRDRQEILFKYIMTLVFTLIFGLVYFQLKTDQTSIQNRTGVLFFNVMNLAFGKNGLQAVLDAELMHAIAAFCGV